VTNGPIHTGDSLEDAADPLAAIPHSDAYVFGRVDGTPFNPSTITTRTKRAWAAVVDQDGNRVLGSITPHEARHTYASLMIAAGVNAKALSEIMGHSSITITLDRYGHLFSGARDEAAARLDRLIAATIPLGQGRPCARRWSRSCR
jgi:integrase